MSEVMGQGFDFGFRKLSESKNIFERCEGLTGGERPGV